MPCPKNSIKRGILKGNEIIFGAILRFWKAKELAILEGVAAARRTPCALPSPARYAHKASIYIARDAFDVAVIFIFISNV